MPDPYDPEFVNDVEWSLKQPRQSLTNDELQELAKLEEFYRRLDLYCWWIQKE